MLERLQHVAYLALYETVVALGILLLPVALLARQVGLSLPIHRLVRRVDDRYRTRFD